ncbi:MAG: AsmA family protein [Proteobacteria bacterium]|nr:AsmA family protein [Pseudomonadota bacterium]
MALLRRILAWTVVSVAVLIVAAIVFLSLFDWNRARPWLDARASAAIGRPVSIDGDLTVAWLRNPAARGLSRWVPWPRFTARDIRIGNPAWAKHPQFATLQQIRFSLSPLALLAHRIEIPSLQLTAPEADLERDRQGRATWMFDLDRTPGQWRLALGEVAFDRGKLRLDDDKLDLHLAIAVDPLGKPIPFDQIVPSKPADGDAAPPRSRQPYYFGWTATGTYRGAKAGGSGKIGSVLSLQDATLPFPLQADLELRDLRIAFAGTLTDPAHLAAFNLRLKMSGASMSHLYALTGVTLPDTPPFSTEGQLTGKLQRGASTFHYGHFNGRVGGSDLHGSVTYTTAAPRPKLTGVLTSNLLRFDDLAPLIGADSNAEKARRGDATKQPADKLLPVESFSTARWRAMDADVNFSGRRILRKAELPIQDLSTHLVLEDGVLTLDPLRFGFAGGDLDSTIALDGRVSPMRGDMKLAVRRLRLRQLFPTVELMKNSSGEINGAATLSGRGNSVAALLGSSTGEMRLLMNGGTISHTLMEEAGLNVANVLVDKLFGDKPVQIECAAADFTGRNGVYDSRLFAFQTEDSTVGIDGTVDFSGEKLDLTLHPRSRSVRVLSLRSPLYVRGTFKDPDVGVEKGPLLARAAGAITLGTIAAPLAALGALIAPSHGDDGNACGALLAELSKQPPQAPPPGKAH